MRTLFAAATGILTVGAELQCQSNSGDDVDWWVMLKGPGGLDYAYADATTPSGTSLKKQPHDMNYKSSPSALIRTLKKVTGDSGNTFFFYSDQPPSGHDASNVYGHTKGIVAENGGDGGLWITHSTPEFPISATNVTFPWSEHIYGQAFLCVSLTASMLDAVGGAMLYNRPYVYYSAMQATSKYPNLGKVLNKEWITDAGTYTHAVTSRGGQKFQSFAKNLKWNQDLYEDLIAPTYKTSLYVESWIRGQALGKYCKSGGYAQDVTDVKSIAISSDWTWTESQDHSKWTVSTTGDLVCICDINRMLSQRKRPGGGICMNHHLASMMRATISDMDTCGDAPVPPAPSPTTCCHSSDSTCNQGQVCCTSGCDDPSTCSYTQRGCTSAPAKTHGCVWTSGKCVVG